MSFYKNIPLIKPELECVGINNIEYKNGDIGWFKYEDRVHVFNVEKNTTPDTFLSDGCLSELGQCINCIFNKYNLCNTEKCKPLCPEGQTFVEI